MKNVTLIIGGSGVLGSSLVKRLLKEYSSDDQIIVVDKNKFPSVDQRVKSIVFDLNSNNYNVFRDAITGLGIQSINKVIFMPGINYTDDLFETDALKINSSYAVNTTSLIFIIKSLLDLLQDNTSIVVTGSQNGIAAHSNRISYSMSKAALLMLLKNLTLDFSKLPNDIRINGISPTYVYNEKNADFLDSFEGQKLKKRIPYEKFITVDEVIDIVMFLMSDLSKPLRGQNIILDYGYSLVW
ncbi:SDR family oxidoreductase [Priestia megaterium]|uniref:SDR family oxidoreductase n=1 Tax=Priestia megaterium TaxID=1404 RepID=UPI0039A320A5